MDFCLYQRGSKNSKVKVLCVGNRQQGTLPEGSSEIFYNYRLFRDYGEFDYCLNVDIIILSCCRLSTVSPILIKVIKAIDKV